jgi:hypothetical protein
MVVKKEKKRGRGRPASDPDDLRSERIALRSHPDLVNELNHMARAQGITRSVLIERALIDFVNEEARAEIVDMIGRYTVADNPPPITQQRPLDTWRRRRPK